MMETSVHIRNQFSLTILYIVVVEIWGNMCWFYVEEQYHDISEASSARNVV